MYPGLGLSRGSFFDRDRFGTDKLVTGDPTDWVADDIPRERRNGRPLAEFIGDFPLPSAVRAQLLELFLTIPPGGEFVTRPAVEESAQIEQKL